MTNIKISLSFIFFIFNFYKSIENFKYLNIESIRVSKMKQDKKDKWLENTKYIVRKISKTDIRNTLMFFYEMNEVPEIIILNRGNIHLEGFIKLSKKIFKFDLIFLRKEEKTILRVSLQYGKEKLEKSEEIFIIEYNDSLEIQLVETKQYLFSVYF